MNEPKPKITYLEFANKVTSGFGVVDNEDRARRQIDAMMRVKDEKTSTIMKATGDPFDMVRRFKQVVARYDLIQPEQERESADEGN